jgi:excisionase family DNA binding protein
MDGGLLATAVPGDAERVDAEHASRALARLAGHGRVRVEAVADDHEQPAQTFILPAAAVRLLTDMLAHLAQGRAVAVLPEDAALTTQQAADMLNVSRPYLVQKMEAGAIPFHKAGTHRRIYLRDLLAYRERRTARSRALLKELTQEAQDLGMGY